MSKWALFITVALLVGGSQFHTLGLKRPRAWRYLAELLSLAVRVLVACSALSYPVTNAVIATVLRLTLPWKLACPSIIKILCKVGHFSTSAHCAFAVKRRERSVICRAILSCKATNIEVCFIWPSPLSTADVKLTDGSFSVVCVAPEVIPITRVYRKVLYRSQPIMLIAQIVVNFFCHILDCALDCWTLYLGCLICYYKWNCSYKNKFCFHFLDLN